VSTTVVYDAVDAPKVTLTRTDELGFVCIIELDGLAPQRSTTPEERAAGITSFDPPTIVVRAQTDRAKAHRALLDASWRAVSASATSTTGETGGPGGLAMTCYRITAAVRHALRMLDEDI
jgi:hypothetical protein